MAERPACAICQEPVGPRGDNKAYPFCSARCQLVDLSHWLDGEYRLPDGPGEAAFGRSRREGASD